MKINKLILSSVAALALAGAFAPVADAYYYSEATDTEYGTLVNIPESEYVTLLNELAAKVETVRGQIGVEGPAGSAQGSTGLILAVKNAEAAVAAAEEEANATATARDEAKVAYNEAVAALEAAKLEVAEAQAAVRAIEATYGEYTQKKDEAQQAHDLRVHEAEKTYLAEEAVALAPYSEAYNEVEAARSVQIAAAYDETSEGFLALEPGDQQAVREKFAAADSVLKERELDYEQARVNYNNAISAAESKYEAEKSAASAALTDTLNDLRIQYENSDVYGEYATLELAEEALRQATAAVESAQNDLSEAADAYEAAVIADNAAQSVLRDERYALAAAQANLANAYARKASYEANLHELVVGQNYNTHASDTNLTKEQQKLVEEIAGQSSDELAEKLAKAKADAEAAKKHAEELRNQDGEPGDGEPGDGEPGDGEPGDGEPGDGEPGDGDDNGTPAKPVKPGTPAKPAAGSGAGKAQLPETGESSAFAIYGAAALSVLAGVGLIAKKREEA